MFHRTSIISILFLFLTLQAFPISSAKNCMLSGKVIDSTNTEGLAFASVQLISWEGSTLNRGVITDNEGLFVFENLQNGKYSLLASYMGYNSKTITINIQERKRHVDLFLSKKDIALAEAEITSTKQYIENSIEKTTINVSKNKTVTAGTAVDVMQTLPAVDFDVDGNMQYRGSSKVTVLLNGQKSELVKSLDQIPADQIEKIEIINNPSAKYDAEGMSGIINIVLKSGKNDQNKTTLMMYAGYPETLGGNAGYSSIFGQSQFFVNAGINHKTKFQTKEHLRENYENPNANNYYQYDRQDETLNDAFLNTNYSYRWNDNQNLSVALVGSTVFNSADRGIEYKTLDKNGQTVYESYKEIDISKDNYSIDGNLNYNYRFRKKGQQFKTNLHYTIFNQLQEMDNVYYPDLQSEETDLQNTFSNQLNKETVVSLDYAHPFKDSLLLETGYRLSAKDLLNDFTAENYNQPLETWENDTALSNTFNYVQYIKALYLNFNIKLKFIDIQAGLRGEYTFNKQDGQNKDAYFDLFPSLQVSKQLTEHINVFISYNRRINRPTIKMLNPFTDEYADILNMHIGNPDLKPEYVNSIEAGTQFIFDKVSLNGSVYYRLIDQAISRVKSASNDSALLVTFMNLDKASLLGGEISVSYKPFSWWSFNTNGSLFYTTLSGVYGPNTINKSHTGWTINMTNGFKLPAGFGLQISGYYRSKLPDVMGTYMARYFVDMAMNKSIIKGKGKLIFKISDVFNTYRYGLDLVGIDENGYHYSQTNRRKNESQYFILSFVYNIDGKEKKQQKTNFYLEEFGK